MNSVIFPYPKFGSLPGALLAVLLAVLLPAWAAPAASAAPADVVISAPVDGAHLPGPSATIDFTVDGSGPQTIECDIDSDVAGPVACDSDSSHSFAALGAGLHNVTVTSTNNASQTGSDSVSFTIDDADPIVTLTAPTNAQLFGSSTVSAAFTITEANLDTVECQLDSETPVACDSNTAHAFTGISNGSHSITVTATDLAGRSATAGVSFSVDTTPPVLEITAPADGQAFDVDDVSVEFGATDVNAVTYECSIDNGAFSACTSPLDLTDLIDGTYSVEVHAEDAAGNDAYETVGFTIDTIAPAAPTVTRTAPTADPTNSASQTISYSGAEPGGTFECKLDAAAFAACPTSPLTLTSLTDTTHTYSVRQIDAAGNPGSVASVTWTVDTVGPAAPTLARTTPTANPTSSTSQEIEFTGAEGGGTLECRLDSAAYAACPSSPVTLTGLSDASHTYSVRQIDDAGNVGAVGSVTWTVDTTGPAAPTVARTTPTANPTNSTGQTITYSGAEPGGTFECKLDAAVFAACSASPVTVSGLLDGSHTFSVRQIDAAGNVGAAGSVTWTVDTIVPAAPTVTRTTPTADPTSSTSQTITYSGAEPGGTFECKLDATAFSACSASPVTLTGLTNGSRTYSVRQIDAAGNIGSVASVTWTVDTIAPTAPTVTRTAPTADPTMSTSQTISYSGAEPGGTYECKLDAAAFGACPTTPLTLTGLTNAQHTYSVRQIDAAGNIGAAGSVTWTVDTIAPVAPTVTRTAPTADPTNSTSQTISYSGAEPGGTFECKLDSAAFAACPTSPLTLTSLTDTTHTYSVRQIDAAGNVGSVSSVTWTVDTVAPAAPTVTRTAPTANPTNSTSQTISFTPAEGGGTLACKLDSASYAPCPANPVTLTSLIDGSHTYSVRQTDAAGNTSLVGSVTWTVDTIAPAAPTVTRTVPTANPTNSTSQTISFTPAEGGGTLECKLDAASYAPCPASPVTLTGLTDASHTYSVRQTDAAGNVGAEGSVTWTVDTVAPAATTVTRTAPTADPTNSTSQSISYSGAEPGGTFECKLDAAAFAACPTSPLTLTGLSDALHTYSVRQIDAAGNAGSVTSVTWTVDTIAPAAPTVTRTAPTADPTNSTSQTISFTMAEGGGTRECKLDSGNYAPCPASPVTLTGLIDGSHTYSVRQIDAAGNASLAGSVTWTVDTIGPAAPTVTRTTPTANPTNSTSQTISFTMAEGGGTRECKLDAASYGPCPASPVTLTGLTDAEHTYYVRQTDAAGNIGAVGSVTWTVDTVVPAAPTVTRTSPTADPVSSTSQTISYTGAEPGGTFQCRLDSAAFAACPASPLTLTSLGQGPHTYRVRQVDAAGNFGEVGFVTWTVDTILPAAPTVTRTSPTANPTNSTSQTISFTPAEGGGTLACKLDAASYEPCPVSPVTLTDLDDGSHTYSVRQTDAAGNIGAVGSVTWTVDTIAPAAPTVTRTAPTANPTNSTSQTITYSGAEAGGTYECKLDSGSFGSCPSSPVTLNDLGDGPHTATVRQIDAAGNIGAEASVTWTVDTDGPPAPTVTRTAPTADPTNSTSQTIEYSGNEAGGSYLCKLDSAAFAPCSASPVTLTGLTHGTHSFYVRQVDTSGNAGAIGSVTWTVDTIAPNAPTVTRTTPTASPTNSTNQTISFTAAEGGGTLACKLDSASYAPCPSSPTTLSGLLDGSHTYSVRQTDAAGNIGAVGSVTWTVDTVAPAVPTVTRTTPTASPTNSTSQTISYSGAEGGGTYQCKLGAAAYSACSASPVTLNSLGEGSRTYAVRQIDAAGNIGDPTTVAWVIDITDPAITIGSPASGSYVNVDDDPTATFTASDTHLDTVTCKLNNAPVACSNTSGNSYAYSVATLGEGSHDFEITVTDTAGNDRVADGSFVVDTIAPAAAITSPSAGSFFAVDEVTKAFTRSDTNLATVECRLDSGAYGACASPISYANLTDGSHTSQLRVRDLAGNETLRDVQFTIDTIAPAVTITSPTNGQVIGSSEVAVAFTANDATALTFECKRDSGDFAACGNPFTITGLDDGSYTSTIRATDRAGNTSTGSAQFSVDLTSPDRAEVLGVAKPKGKTPLKLTKKSRLIFRDEFNDPAINRRKWSTLRGTLKFPYASSYNIDKEAATYSRQNVAIENGKAVLTLKRKPEGEDPTHPYSSGMIHSGNHFSFKHGYVEARVKVPRCSGCWPAFWMLNAPVDEEWPPEIDIFEFFNTLKDKRPKMNVHWKAGSKNKQWGSKKYGDVKRDYTGGWHTYGLAWNSKRAQVFVDGKPGPIYKTSRNLPKKANYLIFNLALQKGFNPTGERKMSIDYVRVWK